MGDPDQAYLDAAEGYLDLGLFLEANEELEKIDPGRRHLPPVLDLRVKIYEALGRWELMEVVAKRLAELDSTPGSFLSWAYAVQQFRSVADTREILLEAVRLHPANGMVHLKLACCAAQLEEVDEAKQLVRKAISLDPSLRMAALEEPDLEPVWESLGHD